MSWFVMRLDPMYCIRLFGKHNKGWGVGWENVLQSAGLLEHGVVHMTPLGAVKQ